MKAKEFEIKKRDPNWRAMQDIRRSGAGGQHKDKKKAAKQGQVKHKAQMAEGDEPDEEYLDKVISDLHKDALGFRPNQEFGQEWMSSSFEEKLEIYNNLLKSLHSDIDEASDFGEPREILETVLQTLEREVEWPLTDVMDPREVRQLLAPIVKAVNDKMMSMEEGWDDQDDWIGLSRREFKRRELEHELGHEDEMANYAVLINNKKWKVFDNKRAAEKAAMTIQQKYGKETRVVQTMERPS